MEDYKSRLATEYEELVGRLDRLRKFIVDNPIESIASDENKSLLYIQEAIMTTYERVLAKRISLIIAEE